MKIIIDISDIDYETIELFGEFTSHFSMNDVVKIIKNGTPLSELEDKWRSSYEQMCQEKICELNKRKKELENQLNISVQNNIAREMIRK